MRCRWTAIACALLMSGALVACGRDDVASDTGSDVADEPIAQSSTSSPFTIDAPPSDYTPIAAGAGTDVELWGSDSVGTNEPFTVLAPAGAGADDPRAISVSVTGFDGYEGGLHQAANGYPANFETTEELTIDGRDALYLSPTDGNAVAELVVDRGNDVAVRIDARHLTKAQLVDFVDRVTPATDHAQAPDVDPPDGYEVIGSVDADAIVALQPYTVPFFDRVPGLADTHTVVWWRGALRVEPTPELRGLLAALTIPSDSVDLAALAGHALETGEYEFSRYSRVGEAAVLEYGRNDSTNRAVFLPTAWGDVVMVVAMGDTLPTTDEMIAMASSARPASAAEWEQVIVAAAGGPGLHADADGIELARGTADAVGWLLQARPSSQIDQLLLPVTTDQLVPDPCLKLSNRHRVCANSGASSNVDSALYWTGDDSLGSFVVVETETSSASVRITTATATANTDLVPVPGGDTYAAVVFVDDPGLPRCDDSPPADDAMRIDLLDARGLAVGCLAPL